MIQWADVLAIAGGEPLTVAAITISELLYGVERARPAHIKEKRSWYVENVIGRIAIASFGLPEARHHARIHALLVSRGSVIGSADLLIAATVLATDMTLLTFNAREFRRVPGLRLSVGSL